MTLPILSPDQARLYEQIYRCESCSHFTDPDGVSPFASRSPTQTVAVSHFGKVKSAPMWLLLTNPRGTDRSDTNVGLNVRDFAANRGDIQTSEIPKIFQHFSDYNFDTSSPDFWEPWRALLDIKVRGKTFGFNSGEICAVDLIKCPTSKSWTNLLHKSPEAREVWKNCHCYREQNGHFFLREQIRLHKPRILIRPGTAFNGRDNVPSYLGVKKGQVYKSLRALIHPIHPCNYVKGVRCLDHPNRLTIETGSANQVKKVAKDTECLGHSRAAIQQIIETWLILTENEV